jgi:hypothetical protein
MSMVSERLRRDMVRLLETDFAHDRLATALFEILADGLDLGPCAVRSVGDRAWVRDAISGPIQRTANGAIERLVAELTRTLASGPACLVERIVRAEEDPTVDVEVVRVDRFVRSPVTAGY